MVEDAYANGEIFEITSTDHSENDLEKSGASSQDPSLPQLNASARCEPELQRDIMITAQLNG